MTGMEDRSQPISTARYTLADGEMRADAAWINYWRKAFVYSGRATRAEYNWAFAMVAVIWTAFGLPAERLISNVVVLKSIGAALLLILATPWFALISRRCHDMNRRGTFGLLMLVPGVGFIVTTGFMVLGDSDPRGARFDQPPAVPLPVPSVKHTDLSS